VRVSSNCFVATRRCVTLLSIWDKGIEELPDDFLEVIVSTHATRVGGRQAQRDNRGGFPLVTREVVGVTATPLSLP
jgi:hypothetical protein